MRKVSFLKKIKLFNFFKRIVRENQSELALKFNIRVDKADRLYTVLNIPEELIGEAYSLKKIDIDRISQNYIKKYSTELSDFLNKKGLSELFDFYKMDKVGKYSYLIVFGFSLFKSHKYYNNLYFVFTPLMIIILSLLFLLF
jgi:hypothetical protein